MTVNYHVGDVLELTAKLPDDSIDAVVGSPPFLQLRDYAGMPGQWGGEPDPATYLDNLLKLTVELRRVLTPWGSIAFELGDTYSGSGGGGGDYLPGGIRYGQNAFNGSAKAANDQHGRDKQAAKNRWPLSKSLTGVPTLFAWSLAYGRNLLDPAIGAERVEWIEWICRLARLGISAPSCSWLTTHLPIEPTFDPWRIRNVIVWARNNPAVGALGDKVRPATSYITVACPSGKRWFDLEAVRSEHARDYSREVPGGMTEYDRRPDRARKNGPRFVIADPAGAPPLDHWTDEYDGDTTWLINTAGSSLAHYAMWPAKLAERIILSMCPAQVCRRCGEPRRRITIVEPSPRTLRDTERMGSPSGNGHHGNLTRQAETVGWSDCGHDDYRPGHLLDPFAGTGTSLAVADLHGRDATGFDLDPANPGLYDRRYAEVKRSLFGVRPERKGQLGFDGLRS